MRMTETYTVGKGITTSYSIGNKNGRTTVSYRPNGKPKITNTIRSGDMWMTENVTKSSRIKKPKPFKIKKGRRNKNDAPSLNFSWIVIGFIIGFIIAILV